MKRMVRNAVVRFLAVLFVSTQLVGLAAAQAAYTAQVRGVVTDSTHAVVSGAKVTITNDGTNIAVTSSTDDNGYFLFAALRPAAYTIRVEAPGFQVREEKNVVLGVNQQTSLNFVLQPAGTITTVEVTTAAPLLDTDNASIGTDVTNEYVRDIPLYNRSFYGLVFLAGGVTETTGSGINDNYPAGTNFVSNGQRNATAQVTLDGSPISAPEQGEGGNSNVYFQPSVEIVQEFKVQNNSFSAEFGSNGGTVVNIVLKQGTNKFHGSGWWYGQRAAFDARDYFNSGEKPDHLRDQYGFALGGPIKKNRTFFFADFEKVRQQDPVNIEGVVPTELERGGDFSESPANLPDPNRPEETADAGVYDPCAGNTDPEFVCPRTKFSDGGIDNKIPSDKIDPIGQKLLNLYPHANVPGAIFPSPNFRTVTLDTHPRWQFDVKIDHQISANQKLGGRYSRGHDRESVPTIVANEDFNDGIIYPTDVHNANLEYNWAIKPTALWTSRLSLDRVHAPGQSNHYPTLSQVELPSVLAANGLDRVPRMNVGDGFLSMFSQCCVDTAFAHTLFSYSSGMEWVMRSHSIKFGGEQRVFFNNFRQPDYPTGTFNFTRNVTTMDPNAGLGDNNQGNPFATMLVGFPAPEDSQLHIVPAVSDKSVETAFYVQDDWKVSSKLTLNLGLRYEWSTPYSERFNQLQFSDFSGSTGVSIPLDRSADYPEFGQIGNVVGTTIFASSNRRHGRVDRNNFAPRLGFAYQLTPNTVIRGGAGMFYGMNVATNFQYAGPSFSKLAPIYFTKDNFVTQYATLSNPFPAGLTPPQGRTYGQLANWGFSNGSDLDTGVVRNAEIYQWNVGVQRLLPKQIVIGVDYSANRSTHLPWAGAGGTSTREHNFLPSSIRDALVASLNPDHDPNSTAVSDFLATNVPNPFQCFFTTVGNPGSYCPENPIFNPQDVADSLYVNDTIPQGNLLRPFPQFDGGFQGLPQMIATSWYNSLQIRFQKRASHYVSFEGNYTLSRAKDNSSAGRNAWIGNLQYDNPQLLDNLKAEYGISSNDATHRLTTAFILEIPVGRGRWIGGNMGRVSEAILGSWSLDSFITLQSGQPLTVYNSALRLVDGNQRPNIVCSQLTTGLSYRQAARTGQPYLNQDCFADPGDNIPGNAPRHFSNLRTEGIRNLDMSLSKDFKLREDKQLQIRAEMFNVANHQRFAFPDVASGDGSFGMINQTTGNYRRMQFGARLQF